MHPWLHACNALRQHSRETLASPEPEENILGNDN